jgi:hypothetical protein
MDLSHSLGIVWVKVGSDPEFDPNDDGWYDLPNDDGWYDQGSCYARVRLWWRFWKMKEGSEA